MENVYNKSIKSQVETLSTGDLVSVAVGVVCVLQLGHGEPEEGADPAELIQLLARHVQGGEYPDLAARVPHLVSAV